MIPVIFMRFPGHLPKALTLSYDDGVEQDIRLMEILNRYGIKATFNLNSGCWAPEGHVWPQGQIHRRMTRSRALALYNGSGHEVAVHCLNHASLTQVPSAEVVREVMLDRINLERDFGGIITGMAYPFGTFSDSVVEALRCCGITYSRTVISTRSFDIPQDWLRLPATCHHDDPMLMELADRFIAEQGTFGSKLFYLWGHSYEFEANDNWQVIETFCEKLSGRNDIWYATNGQIVDYVNAYGQLVFSADGTRAYNPTAIPLYFDDDNTHYTVQPGETVVMAR